MSLSKPIQYAPSAPAVFIGEKRHDANAEARAEKQLRGLFPLVSLITTPDGSKFIPIAEVFKMAKKHQADSEIAKKMGFENGHKIGLEKGLDEARNVLGQFEKAIQDAVTQRAEMLEQAKQKILQMTIQISKKVTFDAIEVDREATIQMIEAIINQLVDRSQLRIKVHPDHLPLIEQNMDRFLSHSTAIKDLKFEADPRVRVGGCFIETPTGDIDARLSSQFEVIEETLQSGSEAP